MFKKSKSNPQNEKSVSKASGSNKMDKSATVVNPKPTTPVQTNRPAKKRSAGRKFVDFLLCRRCCPVDDDEPTHPTTPAKLTIEPRLITDKVVVVAPTPVVVDKLTTCIDLSTIDPTSAPVIDELMIHPDTLLTPSSSDEGMKLGSNEVIDNEQTPTTELIVPATLPSISPTTAPTSNTVKPAPKTIPIQTPSTPSVTLPSVNNQTSSVISKQIDHSTTTNRKREYVPQEEDDSYAADDESLDSSSSDVSSDDFDYETLYFQIKSELNKLKKESAAKEQQLKAEWSEIKTELEMTKKRESELQIDNQKLIAEQNQLAAEKEKQRLDHAVSLANAIEDHKMALSEIKKLTLKNVELEESVAIETSWKESLKVQLEAKETINADAQSKLKIQIQQQGDKIQELERQLESTTNEKSSMAKENETVTSRLAAVNKQMADASIRENQLIKKVKGLQAKLDEDIDSFSSIERMNLLQSPNSPKTEKEDEASPMPESEDDSSDSDDSDDSDESTSSSSSTSSIDATNSRVIDKPPSVPVQPVLRKRYLKRTIPHSLLPLSILKDNDVNPESESYYDDSSTPEEDN